MDNDLKDNFDVDTALELALEEVEGFSSVLEEKSQALLSNRDREGLQAMMGNLEWIDTFKEKLSGLRKEWEKRSDAISSKAKRNGGNNQVRKSHGRLKRGEKTHQSEFVIPILKSLKARNGKADSNLVLDDVEKLLEGVLKPVDFEPIQSDPDLKRWVVSARWCRNEMVNDGLLSGESKRGTWDITPKGEEYLKQQS